MSDNELQEPGRCKICGAGGLPWWWVFCEECIGKIRDEQAAKMKTEKFLRDLKAPP